jgi:hypothetical protein
MPLSFFVRRCRLPLSLDNVNEIEQGESNESVVLQQRKPVERAARMRRGHVKDAETLSLLFVFSSASAMNAPSSYVGPVFSLLTSQLIYDYTTEPA